MSDRLLDSWSVLAQNFLAQRQLVATLGYVLLLSDVDMFSRDSSMLTTHHAINHHIPVTRRGMLFKVAGARAKMQKELDEERTERRAALQRFTRYMDESSEQGKAMVEQVTRIADAKCARRVCGVVND